MVTARKKVRDIEAQWQREEDARTLARYQEIMGNAKRRSAALSEARKQAAELEKRSNLIKKALGGKLK